MAQIAFFVSELIILMLIFYQDLKDRAVNWVLFPGLALLGFLLSMSEVGWESTMMNALFNMGVLTVELSVTFLYFFVKTKQVRGFINIKLGIGDIWMLFALSFSFSPVFYTLFILTALILSLIFALLGKKNQTIPLAGYLSLFYFMFLTLNYFALNYNVYTVNLRFW